MSDPVLTAPEVAAELGVCLDTVRRMIHRGELKAVKRGNRFYVRRSWVEDFLTPTTTDVA